MNYAKILKKGILDENPTLVQVIGMCPILAVTTSVTNGVGMGLATTAVLTCSNVIISLIKKIIPDDIRIPAYVVVISSFVTIVEFLLKAYLPALNKSLGVFIPLIVVNCLILARAESFANKNSVGDSFFDGVGMGLGFTLALIIMSSIRELIGSGTLAGIIIIPESIPKISIMVKPPGAFFTLGFLIAGLNYFKLKKSKEVS